MTDSRTWVRPEVRALAAYSVPDARGLVKLDAMENPYAWPLALRQEWLQLLADEPVNRYPEPVPADLMALVRAAAAIPESAGVMFGNGSDELIQILALALRRECTVMAPQPTFVMYRLIAQTVGLPFVGVPLRSDFALDMAAMRAALTHHRPGLLFLSYPNNPTGNLFSEDDLRQLIE
ncbi:MAG TPA: aminotransferase class I/II-fold pyridoxal phosphate-dependent enzyme, partial [Acidiferrobacteraceae bacterium]|nr:aminotransferase class I/II-fold pyridoxal phosphate-dependent enzyme [Acidiferrobacteraceae bacterium]